MKAVSVSQTKPLSDSDQTIAEIRALRREWSQKYKTFEDIKRFEKEVDEEMKKLGVRFRKVSK